MNLQRDPLTGLFNRNYLFLTGEQLLDQAKATGAVLGFIVADIDGMKPFNDINSLPSGDRLIVRLAQVVQSHLPAGAFAARYGGDEFLVAVLAETETVVIALAESIRQDAKEVVVMGGSLEKKHWDAAPVTLTLGLSFYPRHGGDLQALIMAADKATFQGKRAGRDCVSTIGSGE